MIFMERRKQNDSCIIIWHYVPPYVYWGTNCAFTRYCIIGYNGICHSFFTQCYYSKSFYISCYLSMDGYSLFYISWRIDGIWWYIQKIVEFGNRFNWIYYWWFGNGNSISEHVFCSYFRFWASYRCCYRIFYDPIDERSSIQARICCSDYCFGWINWCVDST